MLVATSDVQLPFLFRRLLSLYVGPLASTRSKFCVCVVNTHGYGGRKGIETSEHVSFAAFVKKPSARITNVRRRERQIRGTQREYNSKPVKHSIVKRFPISLKTIPMYTKKCLSNLK